MKVSMITVYQVDQQQIKAAARYYVVNCVVVGTVVEEFEEPIQRLKNSREYHSDKKGHIVSPVAKVSQTSTQGYVCSNFSIHACVNSFVQIFVLNAWQVQD